MPPARPLQLGYVHVLSAYFPLKKGAKPWPPMRPSWPPGTIAYSQPAPGRQMVFAVIRHDTSTVPPTSMLTSQVHDLIGPFKFKRGQGAYWIVISNEPMKDDANSLYASMEREVTEPFKTKSISKGVNCCLSLIPRRAEVALVVSIPLDRSLMQVETPPNMQTRLADLARRITWRIEELIRRRPVARRSLP